MSYEHFGTFLRELRESRGFTREQLAKDICTPKQIYRIEKGEYEPSIYLLHKLSIKFNLDLNEYYKMYFSVYTITGLEGIQEINRAIGTKDVRLLKKVIDKYEKHEDFNKGENFQHICYGKAICAACEQDFNASLAHCMAGIRAENPAFSLDTITKTIYSNVGLSIISCMGLNYISLGREAIGLKLLNDLLYILEKYVLASPYPMYQTSQFSKKVYQSTLYNLSCQFLNQEKYDQAELLIKKGIDFSIQENSLRFLPDLYFIKFKLLYKQKKYKTAKEVYTQMRCLYLITKQAKVVEEMDKAVVLDYPKLFQESDPGIDKGTRIARKTEKNEDLFQDLNLEEIAVTNMRI